MQHSLKMPEPMRPVSQMNKVIKQKRTQGLGPWNEDSLTYPRA